ncbi:MAG TPA: transcription factor FapR [Bacillota bacterium]
MSDKEEAMLQRQRRIQQEIAKNPFITDEELAAMLDVSIHTIRVDRRKIGIPDVRKRTREVAVSVYGQAKTLTATEITGDLLEVELDREGLSLLDITGEMVSEKSGIARGHILFAQANSLANAIVDAAVALTGEARIKFIAPVRLGERVLAKAHVVKVDGRKREVEVIMKTKKNLVFQGIFLIYCLSDELAHHLNIYNDGEECEHG